MNAEVAKRLEAEAEAVTKFAAEWPTLIEHDEDVGFEKGLPYFLHVNNFPKRGRIPTGLGVPGALWVPPIQRKLSSLPAAYKKIRKAYPVEVSDVEMKDELEDLAGGVSKGDGFAPDPFDFKGLKGGCWQAKSWPVIRATFLDLHLDKKYEVAANSFAVESAGWDLAEGSGFFGFGKRRFWLRNECGCSVAVLDLDGTPLDSFFVDTYRSAQPSMKKEFQWLETRLKALRQKFPGKVLMFGTRNSAVPTGWRISENIVHAVDAVVGETKLLAEVCYRQAYGLIGMIGGAKPVEMFGARGTLVRIEAKARRGECVQTKLLHFDIAARLLEAVPRPEVQTKNVKVPIRGNWANDPIDLVRAKTKRGLKVGTFPFEVEYLPHNRKRASVM
jgi:hypothetical protein